MSITPRVTRRLYERMQLAPDVKRRTPVSKFDGATRAPSVTSEISRSFFPTPFFFFCSRRDISLGTRFAVTRLSRAMSFPDTNNAQTNYELSIFFCYKVMTIVARVLVFR